MVEQADYKRLSALFEEINGASQTLYDGFISVKSTPTNFSAKLAQVQLVWGKKDVINNVTSKYHNQYHVMQNSTSGTTKAQVSSGIFPTTWDNTVTSISPSKKYTATLKFEKPDADNIAEATFTIFSEGALVHTFRTCKSIHGTIYAGSREGGLAWSNDETRIAYVAEKKLPDSSAFWENVNASEKNKENDSKKPLSTTVEHGNKYAYQEDWGEQYNGKKTGSIYIVTIATGKIEEVKGIPSNISCAEVSWTPEDKGLVFTGTATDNPKRLGLIYCYNRLSYLYHVEFQQDVDSQEAKQIDIKALDASTSSAASYRSAVFSPDHKRLAFLATRDVVTHNTCSMLCVLNWQTKETSTVIEIVQEPPVGYSTTGALQAFTGLYCGSLSSKAWSNDGRFIFFNTQMGARVLWKYVEVDAKKILSPPYIAGSPSELASETILDQDGDFVLVSVSSPSAPSSVYLVEIDPNTQQYKQKPIEIVNQSTISKYIKEWSIVPIEVPEDEGSSKKFSSTASKAPLLPQNNSKSPYEASILIPTCQAPAKGYPVLVDVHGGPHGNSPAMYRAVYEYFSALGFVVITVNYRGSTGYGIGPLESLVGKVGTQDIQDVQRAVLHLLDTSKAPLDRTRVSCSGGSHGGFIGAHLVSQYPTFYRCGILRNPVTNISSQFFTSDIPDWGCAVTGIRRFESITAFQSESQKIHQDKKPLTPEERLGVLARMWEMSPMANDLSKVQAPVLLGIGAKDRRVPTTEGLQFRDSIEAFGVETKLLWYPEDCHPLDSIQAYADFAVNWALWLLKHGN